MSSQAAVLDYEVQEVLRIIETLESVQEARDRGAWQYDKTFFSRLDRWFFRARSRGNICPSCLELDGSIWTGDTLRGAFPDLHIIDEDIIGGSGTEFRGLVHPWCYCRLIRVLKGEDLAKVDIWND